MADAAGYSGTPLIKKLGFLPGESVYVDMTPGWYTQFADDNIFELAASLPATHAHMFFTEKAGVLQFLKDNDLEDIEKSLWVSWPKKASKVKSDLTEQVFRDLILPLEFKDPLQDPERIVRWVDVKVAAIDDTWSGLKFLRRK